MEAKRIRIDITGIQRDVSPSMAPLGSCQDMVNLRLWDGALRPIKPKKVLFQATAGQFTPPPLPENSELPPVVSYTLTLNIYPTGNSVKVNGSTYTHVITFPEGITVFLEAIRAVGYQFIEYSGGLISTNPNNSIVMDSDKTIDVVFSSEYVEVWDEANHNKYSDIQLNEALWPETTYYPVTINAPAGWYVDSITYSGPSAGWIDIIEYYDEGLLDYAPLNIGDTTPLPGQVSARVHMTKPTNPGSYLAFINFMTPNGVSMIFLIEIYLT